MRPEKCGPEDLNRDLYIQKGTDDLINLLEIESPELTTSLAMGEYVCTFAGH